MRTAKFLAATAACLMSGALISPAAFAWSDGCKFKADRAAGIDATGVEKVIMRTGAGDLKVLGRSNAVRVEARGVACARTQQALDQTQLSVRREGNVVYVETGLPQNDPERSLDDDDYATLDTGIALPAGIPVEAVDSSGDAVFEGVRALQLQDSSGDLRVSDVAELADITDSSGDVSIVRTGSVRLRDSSGDIEIDGIRGAVQLLSDSSGDIHVADVGTDVTIEQDSSGSIRIEDVRGSATVTSDSSGDIYAGRVSGNFTVESDSTGSIEHESIGGKVSTPSN